MKKFIFYVFTLLVLYYFFILKSNFTKERGTYECIDIFHMIIHIYEYLCMFIRIYTYLCMTNFLLDRLYIQSVPF